MIRTIIYLLTLLVGLYTANAQQIKGKIVDSRTQQGIPYANIKIGETDNTVSNSEGFFTISEKEDNLVLSISYLGYHSKQLTLAELKNNSTVALEEGIFELGSVFISNEKPNADSIMLLVNKNLVQNYEFGEGYKYRIFKRETSQFVPKTMEVDITKSTGFTKKQLKQANEEIKKFINSLIKYPPKSYTDVLVDYASVSKKTDEGKSALHAKAEVIKAIRLADESRSTSLDDLEESATKLFLKHMDTTKFYRIKSGWFGSRDTISLSKEYNEKKKERDRQKKQKKSGSITVEIKDNLQLAKGDIRRILRSSTSFQKNAQLDFVTQTHIYSYSFEGVNFLDDEMVYIIEFKPKKKRAKFTGKLYVSETDYAVMRVDYDLAEGKRLSGINLKLVLGVKAFNNVSNGTLLFRKNPDSEKYYLLYASQEEGQYFYINRPLKFIELTDKDREVVAFDIKVEGDNRYKTEYLNMAVQKITEADVNAIKEKEFHYQTLKKYDPNIWKDFNGIEPIEEMKRFQVIE
ncbi:MAG: carboxypeptidase-like regulatory domain-containing protein [Flavobacteriaceae bacterium]